MQMLFYVYGLLRANDEPFYVGKGSKRRAHRHEYEARRGCKCHKCNVIRKMWRSGEEVRIVIFATTDDEHVAFVLEQELIASYGRDVLVNKTDGGEGTSGLVFSEERRKEHSVIHKQKWNRIGARENASIKARARWNDDTRQQMSDTKKQQYQNSADLRNRLSASAKLRLENDGQHHRRMIELSCTPEALEKRANTNRQRYIDNPELRDVASERAKRMWSDAEKKEQLRQSFSVARQKPEARQKYSDIQKEYASNPEVRERLGNQIKAAWANGETRQRMLETRRSPEYRQKMSDARKAAWARKKAEKQD